MDRFPTPPDEDENDCICTNCYYFCYPEELTRYGCAHCGDELQPWYLLALWKGRPKSDGKRVVFYPFAIHREYIGVWPGRSEVVDWRGQL